MFPRFRFEQRWFAGTDFRTRFRDVHFGNVYLNKRAQSKRSFYAPVYDEIFINGHQPEDAASTQYSDRSRFQFAIGY
ncbi:DUF2490 domain-containing protein [Algoriphagus jejuensis]|uniref:DUF2490 domain-containing protein n=1 Tax=Algoriphagus jejuensis TaxID=419934 RepID=UPI003CD08441